jgi:hypothetical protein
VALSGESLSYLSAFFLHVHQSSPLAYAALAVGLMLGLGMLAAVLGDLLVKLLRQAMTR